ncbi:MAG: RES domain-containing protein [Porphyrobacter sp. IPPAS B-1204]|nr:MAG: RES domain-containing protein [Porphyrobacter sp. IPPAS B-1204]
MLKQRLELCSRTEWPNLRPYGLQVARLADLVDPASRMALDIGDEPLTYEWRLIAGVGDEPVSWAVADQLHASGSHGLAYPSRLTGGQCVVLWDWNTDRSPAS